MGLFDIFFRNKEPAYITDDDYFSNNSFTALPSDKYSALVEKHTNIFLLMYNLDDVNSILSIPVPSQKETRIPTSVAYMPEQILSKKATEHKKSGKLDLAIACLQKANEFRPVSWFSYQAADYMKLVEYLKFDRQFDEARKEQAKLEAKYPDLFGIVHNPKLYDTISKATSIGEDLILFHTMELCPQCSPYLNRIYSVSGMHPFYPALDTAPNFLTMNKCSVCDCLISVNIVSNTFLDSHPDIIIQNIEPIADIRTKEQRELFKQNQLDKARKQIAKIEYDVLWEFMPEICPKSLAAYTRMKNSNSVNFQKIVTAAKAEGFEIKII